MTDTDVPFTRGLIAGLALSVPFWIAIILIWSVLR